MKAASLRALRLALAAALLYGSGAHWIFVQCAAWAGMVAARAERGTVASAVATTFDGRHPCKVCLIVRRGASPDQAPRVASPAPCVDFAFAAGPAAPVLSVSAPAPAPAAAPRPLPARSAPPVPPPEASPAVLA